MAWALADCVEHVQKQCYPLFRGKALLVAVNVEPPALDVLQNQERLAGIGDTGVDEAGDVRMAQPREGRALAVKPLAARRIQESEVEQLDRGASLEATVASVRQPNRAHATFTEGTVQRVRAKPSAGE